MSFFDIVQIDSDFGNARYTRNVIEKAESAKRDRTDIMDILKLSNDDLFQLAPEDFTSTITVKDFAGEKKLGFY